MRPYGVSSGNWPPAWQATQLWPVWRANAGTAWAGGATTSQRVTPSKQINTRRQSSLAQRPSGKNLCEPREHSSVAMVTLDLEFLQWHSVDSGSICAIDPRGI